MSNVATSPFRLGLPTLAVTVFLSAVASLASAQRPAVGGRDGGWKTDQRVRETGASHSSEDAAEKTIRLTFFNAGWETVLNHLAEASGSGLVMDEVPPGRLTRYDRRRYSRTDAIRILNRELEPENFRILPKGDHLVVLNLDSVRARYRRPVLRPSEKTSETERDSASAKSGGPARSFPKYTRNVQTITGHNANRKTDDSPGQRAEAPPGPIRHAAHEEPAGRSPTSPTTTMRVGVRHGRPTEVARAVYAGFKSHAELIDRGPDGLPAFRVLAPSGETRSGGRNAAPAAAKSGSRTERTAFAVGIDEQNAGLVVEGRQETARSVIQLIRAVDTRETNATVRLVPGTRNRPKLAERLRPTLRRLVRQRNETDEEDRPRLPRNQGTHPFAAQPPMPPEQEGEADRQPRTEAVIGGLKGEVTIQDVPGVGLVVTGNEEDVQKVMQIIQELERLGAAGAVEIHLRFLEHVAGEALADLLSSMYEELGGQEGGAAVRAQNVTVLPVVKPNAVLILAPQTVLQSILDLIDELDKPVDPRTEFGVFRLKNAVATQVVQMLDDFYEERGGLGPRVNAIADARTNTVVVYARPNDLDEVAKLIRKVDRDSSDAVSKMRIFPLKNAVAEELAEVINEAIQSVLNPPTGVPGQAPGQAPGAGQQNQQLQEAKSTVLEFLAIEDGGRRTVRSGILADIRVTAAPRTNSLVVTAPRQSMQLMRELIKQLDKPTSTVAEIKVFSLANADATAMADLLESTFGVSEEEGGPGVQVAGAEDASSSLVPLRFSVDVRTNSIIAVGGAEALQVVEAILLRLDESDIRERQTTVIRLKNSPATDVAGALTEFLQSQQDLSQVDPELVSAVEQLQREVIVVPEPVSNSLLISATPRYFDEVRELVTRLDEAPRQVIIQALLVEVALESTDEFGVELGFQDEVLFNRSVTAAEDLLTITQTESTPGTGVQTTTEQIISQAATPGFRFNNQPFGNNIGSAGVNPASVGKQALTNFSIGRVNGELGFGGLVLSAGSESINVLLRALAARRDVEILSRPQIRTLDNQLAQIQVGQQVPIVDGVNVTAQGTVNPLIRQDEAGIIMTVTPRISPEGNIVMEVIAEKSQFTGGGVPIFTDAATGNVVESPIKDITTAQTTVSVRNGQTIVLGGMITETDDKTVRKVPWLGDLPYLGAPFRFDSKSKDRRELLIFLTPRIIEGEGQSEWLKQVESERIHFTEQKAEAMHGPLFAVPPDEGHPGQPVEQPDGPSHEQRDVPPVPQNGRVPSTPPASHNEDVPTSVMPARTQRFELLPEDHLSEESAGQPQPAPQLKRLPSASQTPEFP